MIILSLLLAADVSLSVQVSAPLVVVADSGSFEVAEVIQPPRLRLEGSLASQDGACGIDTFVVKLTSPTEWRGFFDHRAPAPCTAFAVELDGVFAKLAGKKIDPKACGTTVELHSEAVLQLVTNVSTRLVRQALPVPLRIPVQIVCR